MPKLQTQQCGTGEPCIHSNTLTFFYQTCTQTNKMYECKTPNETKTYRRWDYFEKLMRRSVMIFLVGIQKEIYCLDVGHLSISTQSQIQALIFFWDGVIQQQKNV